jgi:molecular chaperone GrpE (heat shock protein)
MIIKLNKLAIAEIDEESIMLKQFYDNRNGNAVMVKFDLKRFYDKFESALLYVRVTSTEGKSSREIAGSRIRLRKGENFPLIYVSSIDAAKDLFLIFEIQTNNFGEYEQFGNLKVYPRNKNEKLKFIEKKFDANRFNLDKFRSGPQKSANPFGMKSPMVEQFNVGGSRAKHHHAPITDNLSPVQIEKLKRQMGMTDEMLMHRLGLTDDALKMRLGLTEELMEDFINNAVMLVRENLGISDDVLNILSFNTQQYSMDIQRLKTTIDSFKNNANYVKNTIEKMDIPTLEKNYSYVEKRYDWAKLRCEQLERKFAAQIEEMTEELKEKGEALDQLLQDFLDWTDEKRQSIQTEIDKVMEFQYKYSDTFQMIENTKTSCTHMQLVDPFERARGAAKRLYEILNQDRTITSQSIKQKFPDDLQERMNFLLQIEDHLNRLIPENSEEDHASWITEQIQAIKDKFIAIRDRYEFYPDVLSEALDGFIQQVDHINYQDIEKETRLQEEKQLKAGPWKSMDPLLIFQERVDYQLEQLRIQYYKEKASALPNFYPSEKILSKDLDIFITKELFGFIQNQLPEIEEKFAQMVSTEKPVTPFFNDIRKNLMSVANIQEIIVEPEKDFFDPELHDIQKTVHRPDMSHLVILETISTGYRLGAIGPVLEKTQVIINNIES